MPPSLIPEMQCDRLLQTPASLTSLPRIKNCEPFPIVTATGKDTKTAPNPSPSVSGETQEIFL